MANAVIANLTAAAPSGLSISDIAGLGSLGVSFVALAVALYAIVRGNRNSSAATMVALNDGFRQGWVRFLKADPDSRYFELAELLNILELAAGVFRERSLTGVSRELAEQYLCGALAVLETDPHAMKRMDELRHSTDTFKYLRLFRADIERSGMFAKYKTDLEAMRAAEATAEPNGDGQ